MKDGLSREELEDMLTGAVLYGSGGGGPKAIGQTIIKSILESGKSSQVVEADEMPDDAWAVVTAGVGSPDAAVDFDCTVVSQAVRGLGKAMGVTFGYAMAAEIGAGNTFTPLFVAADLGIKALNVAGSTRAVPEITMSSFAAKNVPVSHIMVANHGHQVGITIENAAEASGPMRAVVSDPAFGNVAGLAIWPMRGSTVKASAMRGTFDMARELGAALRRGRGAGDPVGAVLKHLDGRVLVRGKLKSMDEATGGGFDRGTVVVEDADRSSVVIFNQNENLIAWSSASSRPLTIAPDLISYMLEDGTVFSNVEAPDYEGRDIVVLAAPTDPRMREAGIVDAFRGALSAIGYPGPTTPLAEL